MIKTFIWVCIIISYCYANSNEYINITEFESKIVNLFKRDTHQHVCSLNSVYIDFSTLGYKWIHEPKGIQITYCRGTCTIGSYDKSSVIYGMIVTSYLNNKQIPLCCSPNARKDITIKYYRGRHLKTHTIHNFMPTDCGCG